MIRKITNINQNRQSGINIFFSFSTDALNVRLPMRDPTTKKLTDEYIHNYENPMFRAYLQKRKLLRSEIWPKIRILEDPPREQQVHLRNQKTLDLKRLLSESIMKRIVKQDPSQINTAFIVSLFSEDHFKQLIDEYLGKVLVCGKCPSHKTAVKMKQIETNVVELFKSFHFGEKISPIERQIQMNYLASKQMKFSYMESQKKNALFRCVWRQQDQRLIEDYINWPQANINLSDMSYRPFYQRLSITSRLPHAKKLYQLIEGNSWLANWNFKTVQKNYVYSIPYLSWISSKIFSRVIQYTKCLQFTHTMKIPADFSIEILVTNIHFWLIINRLKQFNTQKSKNLANMLEEMFRHYVNDLIGQLHMRRQAAVVRRFNQFINVASNTLNRHFNINQKTKNNPYLSIDALVWSVAMKQKTERYSEEVYLFSEYLVKNWIYFKHYSQEDLMDGICEFDCFLIEPDYKEKIISINPPIAKEKFEAQFETNQEKKSFYYSTQIPKEDESERILNVFTKNAKKQKYNFWRELGNKTIHFIKKYMTNMSNYDQMSEMDEQKKKTSIKDQKSPWKTETDRVDQVQKQFDEIEKIKKIRRKSGTGDKEEQTKQKQK